MDKLEYIPGDLVICKPLPKENVAKISEIYDISYLIELAYGVYLRALYEELKPIPLTTEILEKNGWKLLEHHERNSYYDVSWSSYYKPAETNISLRFYPEEDAFFLFLYAQEISETPIKYIHQLQNFLFGLGINHEMKI